MARRRVVSTRGYARSQRQPSNWARVLSNSLVTVPAASKVLLNTVVLSNPGIGETVRRTRGRIYVGSDQSGAIEQQFFAFGMMVVNDLALAAGAASIPGPGTDASDDGWFVWEPWVMSQSNATGVAGPEVVLNFDSKAMRRVEEGYGVALMVENLSATFGLRVALGLSLLSSLS